MANLNNHLSIIILTYNEELHLPRCLQNINSLTDQIYVVDSLSNDRTLQIVQDYGIKVFQNPWPGNHAAQFNWALENLPIKTEWVLRLDADEYLLPELISEIQEKLKDIPKDISGIVFKRRHIFLGKWMKRGIYPVKLLRLFRYQKAICEQRWMDEHIQLLDGKSIEFDHDFVDHNLNELSWFLQKHIGYSIREAIDLLDVELGLIGQTEESATLSEQAKAKREKKLNYARKPLFWRAFAYFVYRFILKGGFLEGKETFLWDFFQGWWYRTLVDAKIWEIKKACGTDKEKIKRYISAHYRINL